MKLMNMSSLNRLVLFYYIWDELKIACIFPSFNLDPNFLSLHPYRDSRSDQGCSLRVLRHPQNILFNAWLVFKSYFGGRSSEVPPGSRWGARLLLFSILLTGEENCLPVMSMEEVRTGSQLMKMI